MLPSMLTSSVPLVGCAVADDMQRIAVRVVVVGEQALGARDGDRAVVAHHVVVRLGDRRIVHHLDVQRAGSLQHAVGFDIGDGVGTGETGIGDVAKLPSLKTSSVPWFGAS